MVFKKNKSLVCRLHDLAVDLCKLYFPVKYQIATEAGIQNSMKTLNPLIKKILNDLLWWRNETDSSQMGDFVRKFTFNQSGFLNVNGLGRKVSASSDNVRTRLYFTSKALLYSFFNIMGRQLLLRDIIQGGL